MCEGTVNTFQSCKITFFILFLRKFLKYMLFKDKKIKSKKEGDLGSRKQGSETGEG